MKEDWIECAIEDVAQILNGDRGKNYPSRSHYIEKGVPFISAGNIGKHSKLKDELNFISEERFELLKAGKLQKGDIVYCIRGSIGKFAIIDFDKGAIASSLCIIRINKTIESSLLCYYLDSHLCRLEIHKFDNGTAQPNLSAKDFKKFQLPLPPLVEQKAIVKKIEELFSSLDSGIADLKRAQDQLKIYRQAVLKKAFEGELTKEWRKLQMVKYEWENVHLDEVLIQSKEKHKPEKIENLFYVGLEHIEKETGNLTENVGEEEIKTVKNKFISGQILYGKLRPYLNKVHLAKKEGVCSTDILVFTPSEKIYGKYALLFMLSRQFVNDMSNNTNGVNLPRVSTKYVNEYKVPLPSLKEQHQIVQEIESRLSVCDAVEQSITESLDKAQALRQSILKKAFEGKLLSEEEIAKCKADKDYEPASVLLEKMKTEKKKK
ncbi:MAG: restriction endonuclease subunit S [Putridiphycobacter sp.]|nr:restriction endonuclease subunit S [Putridiphycobacter sp.]